ncbi:malonate transporter subunit MadL [Nesterenkonia halobia]|uniref:Malonate transporter subunit MadL n=1 Tax=Nesterenkonia halobia TaxID=37922 RepID=A0ABP6RDY4_9MICC
MVVYGVAALALCLLIGELIGEALGIAVGVDANVGGVGFAMILLVLVTDRLRRRGLFPESSERGVMFWSSMYIPIVVAMASTQNVAEALTGGPMAIVAGLAALAAAAALVPVLARIGPPADPLPPRGEGDDARLAGSARTKEA